MSITLTRTLTQLVYSGKKANQEFRIKIWLHVTGGSESNVTWLLPDQLMSTGDIETLL
jgi:hypothetical protein